MRSLTIPSALVLLFVPLIVLLFVLRPSAVQGAAAAPRPAAPARHLPAPEHVSAEARQQVKGRMGQHAVTMENLVRAVVLLDRPTVRVLATRIADEEVVARAGEKRPPSLPPSFFEQQDELATTARQLAGAAIDGGDDKVLADRFAAVTRTCVGCHSSYLHGRPDAQPAAPAPKPAAR